MGPVSFGALDVRASRADALAAAERLAEAGVRVMAMTEVDSGPDTLFQLTVPSGDIVRARELLGRFPAL